MNFLRPNDNATRQSSNNMISGCPRGGFSTEAEQSLGQLYFNRGLAEPRNKLVYRGRGRGLTNFDRGRAED